MVKTTVINLLGGGGVGKSTTACGLFYYMKNMKMSVELVREYVKSWAWKGEKIGEYDQMYITGKQMRYESILYGKVDYIVTDSPILLGPIYEHWLTNDSIMESSVRKFYDKAKENGIDHKFFLLERTKDYVQAGRYQTEDEARRFDDHLRTTLVKWGIPFTVCDAEDYRRPEMILIQMRILPHFSIDKWKPLNPNFIYNPSTQNPEHVSIPYVRIGDPDPADPGHITITSTGGPIMFLKEGKLVNMEKRGVVEEEDKNIKGVLEAFDVEKERDSMEKEAEELEKAKIEDWTDEEVTVSKGHQKFTIKRKDLQR